MPLFPKQAANSLVTETSQYFVVFCRYVCSAILAKCLIINVLRLILVILFFIAFLNITYVARHSFASVLKKSGVNIALISEALGHSDLATTQIYLDSFDNEQVDEAMKNLL
ncbi:MAG: tyrosine-type recombinase/integrase [Bacteroides sp.]|nr:MULTISPECIES: tyrosine-type recombinase/integrase [Bacteroides]MBS6967306.1 tyrosine-type recombinase/integrase [Bacteroides sp.]MDC1831127.1 tyrosine-type recombinase/integrase [Bacteroides uniformis]